MPTSVRTRSKPAATQTHFTLHLLDSTIEVTLPLAGEHNVRNACAAAAIVTALDVPAATIKDGLESASPVSGRLSPRQGIRGATLYDDSYNASPLSVVAAAEFLASLPGGSWFILGDMFELGDQAQSLHAEVGDSIREAGIDRLFAHGELSRFAAEAFGDNAQWYDSLEALIDDVKDEIEPGSNVLVKGSRGMRMERVVEALLGNGED
jgi:UDP-N-acetylmuramoyl-tripeptide--D-alanyl-D-alanine ligase